MDEPIVEQSVEQTPAPETTQAPTPEPKQESAPPVDTEDIKKKAYGHAMKQIDDALRELGHEKPEGVKTSDYLKEILSGKGTKDDPKQVTPTTDDKDTIIKQLKASLEEKESAINELQTSTTRARKEFFVDSLISQAQLNLPQNLSDEEQGQMSGLLKQALKAEIDKKVTFKEVDGKFVAYNKDDQPYLDEKADYLDPAKLLEKHFASFLVKKQAAQTPKGTGGAETPKPKPSVIPPSVKTKYEFISHLQSKGMVLNSPEFIAEMAKAKEENPTMFK